MSVTAGEWVERSRIFAFMGDMVSNNHTAVVLLRLSQDIQVADQFRMGLPSLFPWGLPMMSCPFCHKSTDVSPTLDRGKIRLQCPCGSRTPVIPKPAFVVEVELEGVPPRHFIHPFPLSGEGEVMWRKEEMRLEQRWIP